MWQIRVSKQAKKQLKRYAKTPDCVHFDKAIRELERAPDPTTLGQFKVLKELSYRCFAYDVTRSLHLLYSVDRQNNLILILDLGDHKETYGWD